MKRLAFIVILAFLYGLPSTASTVRLITIGPGDAFWSAFGHTAIAIDEDVYGFGYFSFDDDILTSFVNNTMQYESGVSDFNREVHLAQQQNRDFSVVELNLTDAETQEMTAFLQWHTLPENQSYRYDYFLNNCSTKIRDVLDLAWNNELAQKSQLQKKDRNSSTYFEQTFPAKHQGLMNFGLALGYGWTAYTTKSPWDLMALPVYMEQYVLKQFKDRLQQRVLVYQAESTSQLSSFIQTHWFLGLYVILWSLFLLFKSTQSFTAKVWFVWHGIIGLVMLAIWLFTPHLVMDWNFNLLLMSPIGLFLIRYKALLPLVILSLALWLVTAIYLNAWYLMPLLIPACLALMVVNNLRLNRQEI